MLRASVGRVISVGLVLVMTGLTNIPILDALVYHNQNQSHEQGPHYASTACHAERCAIQAAARDARSNPEGLVSPRIVALPTIDVPVAPPATSWFFTSSNNYHSRAPPSFA